MEIFNEVILGVVGTPDGSGLVLSRESLEKLKKQVEVGLLPPPEQFGVALLDDVKPWRQGEKTKLKAMNPRIVENKLLVDIEVADGAIADGLDWPRRAAAQRRIRNLLKFKDDDFLHGGVR